MICSCIDKSDEELRKVIIGKWQEVKFEEIYDGKVQDNYFSSSPSHDTFWEFTKTKHSFYSDSDSAIHTSDYSIRNSIVIVKLVPQVDNKIRDLTLKIDTISESSLILTETKKRPLSLPHHPGYFKRYFKKVN